MNSLKRYQATVNKKPCDFLPRLPILMAFAAAYSGASYGEFASDYRVLVAANRCCLEAFGFDQVSVISDPYRETTGFGGEVKFIRDGVPRLIGSPLADSKDLRRLKRPDPQTSPRLWDRLEAVKSLKSLYSGQYSILGWVEGPAAEAADLRGITNFFYDLMDDVEFAKELMERTTATAVEFAQAQIAAGADTIGIGDAVVSQISPAIYAQAIFPYQKVLVREIQKAEAWVRLHICGDITQHLPVIKDLGVDILDLDWPVDVGYARSLLGHQTVLVANPDPVADVQFGNPAKIRAQLQQIYAQAGNPLMIGAGCEIPLNTPWENLKALCTPIAFK